MASQRKRLEKALRGCAEAGVPDTTDLWPVVHGSVSRQRTSSELAGEEHGAARARPRHRFPQLVPNTLLGWGLAAMSALILGIGLYAAAESVGDFYWQEGLPGAVDSDPENRNAARGTGDDEERLRTEIGQTKIQDGVKLTVDWAYADERYVAVGLHTQRVDGSTETQHAAVFQPSLWDDTVGDEAELPPYVKITDASGQDFDTVGGGTLLGPERTGAEAVFDAPEGLKVGREHRFHLEVPLDAAVGGTPGEKPEAGPFAFDFEIPVRAAPVFEINRAVEAEGTTLTLERVFASPLLPQAVVCFQPPDDKHDWMPFLRYDESYEKGVGISPQNLGDGCWALLMAASVEGRSSVTVANLEGMPRGDLPAGTTTFNPKTIRGPWTFEFDVPQR